MTPCGWLESSHAAITEAEPPTWLLGRRAAHRGGAHAFFQPDYLQSPLHPPSAKSVDPSIGREFEQSACYLETPSAASFRKGMGSRGISPLHELSLLQDLKTRSCTVACSGIRKDFPPLDLSERLAGLPPISLAEQLEEAASSSHPRPSLALSDGPARGSPLRPHVSCALPRSLADDSEHCFSVRAGPQTRQWRCGCCVTPWLVCAAGRTHAPATWGGTPHPSPAHGRLEPLAPTESRR